MVKRVFKLMGVTLLSGVLVFGGTTTSYAGSTYNVSNGGLTLSQAVAKAKSGDKIVVKGTVKSGSVVLPAGVILKGSDSNAKINFSSADRGITIKGNNAQVLDLDIYNAKDNGIYITGSSNKVSNCDVYNNGDTGVQLSNGASNNKIVNVNSYHNVDSSGGNADGFACKLHTGNGNVFDHCVATENSDDGYDLYAAHGAVKFISCKAIRNGKWNGKVGNGSGFKVGGVDNKEPGKAAHLDPCKHTLTDCYAEGNKVNFDRNNQNGVVTMTRCTGKNATNKNFAFPRTGTPSALGYKVTFAKAIMKNCTSIGAKNDISGATLTNCTGF